MEATGSQGKIDSQVKDRAVEMERGEKAVSWSTRVCSTGRISRTVDNVTEVDGPNKRL